MSSPDSITIEILEDGTIKTTTDRVSMPNHRNAEQFLRAVADLAGGTVQQRRRVHIGQALHVHDHNHDHDHEHH